MVLSFHGRTQLDNRPFPSFPSGLNDEKSVTDPEPVKESQNLSPVTVEVRDKKAYLILV